jgi:hypothetical protein
MKTELHGNSLYTEELAQEICDRISEGEPLRKICRDDHMPMWRTVYKWIQADKSFGARITRARDIGFDAIAEEALDIADETERDTIATERGDVCNTEWISRSKLRVETRLKLLAKWSPRYRDHNVIEATISKPKTLAEFYGELPSDSKP